MSTLLISPDYASHYYGLAALGREGLRRGARVIVATGPALRDRVLSDGFEHVELRLGAGHNDGVNGAGGVSSLGKRMGKASGCPGCGSWHG